MQLPGAFRPALAENDPLDHFPGAAGPNKQTALVVTRGIACYNMFDR